MALWPRRAGVVLLAAALVAVTGVWARAGRHSVVLGYMAHGDVQGDDGMEVDMSTLSRSVQMQDLAHVGGTAMGAGKGQYDALLSNGPLDPPRTSTFRQVTTQALATTSVAALPTNLPGVKAAGAQGIGLGGHIHLLRSAREILAGKMASNLEGHPLSAKKAKEIAETRSGVSHISQHQEQVARAVWQPRAHVPSLKERAAALEAKVRALEDVAGNAEISELSGLSK
jgi:hypothetical protein